MASYPRTHVLQGSCAPGLASGSTCALACPSGFLPTGIFTAEPGFDPHGAPAVASQPPLASRCVAGLWAPAEGLGTCASQTLCAGRPLELQAGGHFFVPGLLPGSCGGGGLTLEDVSLFRMRAMSELLMLLRLWLFRSKCLVWTAC